MSYKMSRKNVRYVNKINAVNDVFSDKSMPKIKIREKFTEALEIAAEKCYNISANNFRRAAEIS